MILKSIKDRGLVLAVILLLLSLSENANGQLANQYSFSSSTGVSLGSVTGSTLIMGSNLDDSASAVIGIGFSFTLPEQFILIFCQLEWAHASRRVTGFK